MPTISTFYGILIRMFYDDHGLPHFHAEYAEYQASISIDTLEVLEGELPRRSLALVLEWAALHRTELREGWELCRTKKQPKKITPLE